MLSKESLIDPREEGLHIAEAEVGLDAGDSELHAQGLDDVRILDETHVDEDLSEPLSTFFLLLERLGELLLADQPQLDEELTDAQVLLVLAQEFLEVVTPDVAELDGQLAQGFPITALFLQVEHVGELLLGDDLLFEQDLTDSEHLRSLALFLLHQFDPPLPSSDPVFSSPWDSPAPSGSPFIGGSGHGGAAVS